VPLEAVADFLRLAIFKRAHSPANPASAPRTSAGIRTDQAMIEMQLLRQYLHAG